MGMCSSQPAASSGMPALPAGGTISTPPPVQSAPLDSMKGREYAGVAPTGMDRFRSSMEEMMMATNPRLGAMLGSMGVGGMPTLKQWVNQQTPANAGMATPGVAAAMSPMKDPNQQKSSQGGGRLNNL